MSLSFSRLRPLRTFVFPETSIVAGLLVRPSPLNFLGRSRPHLSTTESYVSEEIR